MARERLLDRLTRGNVAGVNEVRQRPARVTPIDWVHVGAWGGLLFVGTLALAAVFVLADSPGANDSPAVIRRWAADEATPYLTFMWIATVGHLLLLLPFAAAVAIILERSDRVLAGLVILGAVGSAVVSTVGTAFSASLALGAAADLSDASVHAFWLADGFIFRLVLNAFQALMVGAAAVAVIRYRLMPTWLGLLGALVALILTVDGLWVVNGDFNALFEVLWGAGLGGLAVWMAAASVWILRRAPAEWRQRPLAE